MSRNAIIFLVVNFFCGECLSQQYPFVQYTPKDGLVNNRARLVFQDNRGLLYIATYGGVSVYDGSRFTNYTTKDGLANNLINDIIQISDDSILIIPNVPKLQCLTKGHIRDINPSDGFCPAIYKMMKCDDGSLYALADEGLFKFEKNKFSKLELKDDNGKDAGRFFSDGIGIKNKLFLVTDISVQTDEGPGRVVVYDTKTKKTAFTKETVFAYKIAALSPNEVFVATARGVLEFDKKSIEKNQIAFVNLPAAYRSAEKLSSGYLYFDTRKNLWISSSLGLVRIDSSGEYKLFTVDNGLPANNITSIFQDKENTMWFTNDQNGISKLTKLQFEYLPELEKDFYGVDVHTNSHSDSVWFLSLENKLLLRVANTEREFQMEEPPSDPPARFFIRDGNKNYISDLFNIYECNFTKENKIRLKKIFADTLHNTNLGISCLKADGYGNIIAVSHKIIVITHDKKIITYPLDFLADEFALTTDKKLWVITRSNTLFLFQIHPDDTDHYLTLIAKYNKELPKVSPRSLCIDKKGNLWVGTRDDGLFRLFFEGTTFRGYKQYTENEGLSDNFISFLHVDNENKIWACSPDGLDQIEVNGEKILIENITLSNNVYKHIGKIETTPKGTHWVITAGSVIKIDHGDLTTGHEQPKIIFSEIAAGSDKIDYSLGTSSLSYKKNNISFALAVPSFIDEKQTRFSYLLEGSGNKNWSAPSIQSLVNFVNLSPGKYTFRAKAIFVTHRYPESAIAYSFVILPPWWQTWWFKSLFILLIFVALILIVRNYYRRKLHQQKLILEKQQAIEKERTRIATDMHDDLGAGLSTIRFLSEKVKRNTFSEVTRDDVDKMQSASNELIDKMNEIIWSMNEKNDSLEQLIFYTRSYAMEYCENNNLSCSIQIPENISPAIVSGEVRRNVFLTVKESLHNIVKHANAKNVNIVIDISKSLDIRIGDDGNGLVAKQKTNSGNGMRNMQKRIESIGGNIYVSNGKGVMIVMSVPLASS
ncbi:MAG: hypothetical protein JST75_08520 [Bacteroidetes bacterium]|nr:hypothetical protein [Bacteroidota bacterium]